MSEKDFTTPPSSDQVEEKKEEAPPQETQESTKELSEIEVELTEEDIDKFLECALENKPYKEVYKLFKGKIEITLRTLKVREIDMINKFIMEEMPEVKQFIRWQGEQQKYMIAYILESIKIGDKVQNMDPMEIKHRGKWLSDLEDFIYLEIHESVNHFNKKISELKKNSRQKTS